MRSSPTRTISGRINADGTPANASGWSSRKVSTGAYTVTFAGGFRVIGAVASPGPAASAIRTAYVSSMTGDSITVQVVSSAFALADDTCSFVATGTA